MAVAVVECAAVEECPVAGPVAADRLADSAEAAVRAFTAAEGLGDPVGGTAAAAITADIAMDALITVDSVLAWAFIRPGITAATMEATTIRTTTIRTITIRKHTLIRRRR